MYSSRREEREKSVDVDANATVANLPLFESEAAIWGDLEFALCSSCKTMIPKIDGYSRRQLAKEDKRECKKCVALRHGVPDNSAPSKNSRKRRRKKLRRIWTQSHDHSLDIDNDPFTVIRRLLEAHHTYGLQDDMLLPGAEANVVEEMDLTCKRSTDRTRRQVKKAEQYARIRAKREREKSQNRLRLQKRSKMMRRRS